MRQFKLAFGFISLLILGGSVPSLAADAVPVSDMKPGAVTINTSAYNSEVRNYKVDASVKGTIPNPDTNKPMDVDIAMAFKIKHKYGKREGDGLLPLEISLLDGKVTMGDQTLSISPSIYPKLTTLLDKDFRISDIFGAGDATPGAIPGINYNNMIMLFYVSGPNQSRSLNETWETTITMPALKEAYKVKNTLKSIGSEGDVKTAVVRQEILRVPTAKDTAPVPAMKATAESTFALNSGKLLKSHIECEAAASEKDAKSQQEQAQVRANIKMDVSLAK